MPRRRHEDELSLWSLIRVTLARVEPIRFILASIVTIVTVGNVYFDHCRTSTTYKNNAGSHEWNATRFLSDDVSGWLSENGARVTNSPISFACELNTEFRV